MSRRNVGRGTSRFTQIPHWLMKSEAWLNMKPGPRALYLELKTRFNGSNNGNLFLSHRDAAKALNVGRDTAAIFFLKTQAGWKETNRTEINSAGDAEPFTGFLIERAKPA